MALPAAYTKAAEVINELRLSQQEFDFTNRTDSAALDTLVRRAILNAQVQVYQVVGATNYASSDTTTLEIVKLAEFELSCALMLRKRAEVLSSRPEEAPPPEYIDLGVLLAMARDREARANAMLVPYATEDGDKPGLGWAFGATGIDETEPDYSAGDYEDTDFGNL